MLVILTEEPSMKVFLETLIRRVYPDLQMTIKAFRGKQDLEKGVAGFLRHWRHPHSRFIVVHDQDRWNCLELKPRLSAICNEARAGVAVRIACHELESWYWGDLAAVEAAFHEEGLQSLAGKHKYREPDHIQSPKNELKRHLPRYEQQAGARAIAEHVDIGRNTSHSFHVFMKKLDEFAGQLLCSLK